MRDNNLLFAISRARDFNATSSLYYESEESHEGLSYQFAEAIVQIADNCVIGLPCDRHGGAVHGKEAEELRAGVEQVLKDVAGRSWSTLRTRLISLLDRVDARDSLAFREATDGNPVVPL